MLVQIVGIVFALGIVAAFAALQFGLANPHDSGYLVANLVCAGVLTAIAVTSGQYGFVISNGFWTVVAAVGLWRVARRKAPGGSGSQSGGAPTGASG